MASPSNDEFLEQLAGELKNKNSQFDWRLCLGRSAYVAGVFAAVWIAVSGSWVGYRFSLTTLDIPMVFGVLILASLFVERSVEVFMLTFRDPRACKIEEGVEFYRNRVSGLKSEIESMTLAADLPAEVRTKMMDDRQQIKQKIEKYEEMIFAHQLALIPFLSRRRQFSLGLALLFGVLAASVGFRFFTQILDHQNKLANSMGAGTTTHDATAEDNKDELLNQKQMFNLVDILLTGALLAGGSAAVHTLMTSYTTLATALKKT